MDGKEKKIGDEMKWIRRDQLRGGGARWILRVEVTWSAVMQVRVELSLVSGPALSFLLPLHPQPSLSAWTVSRAFDTDLPYRLSLCLLPIRFSYLSMHYVSIAILASGSILITEA